MGAHSERDWPESAALEPEVSQSPPFATDPAIAAHASPSDPDAPPPHDGAPQASAPPNSADSSPANRPTRDRRDRQDALAAVRVVLVEPAGPLNLGAIARTLKNFGLSDLVLVSPRCDRDDPQARQMAVHAGDLLAGARQAIALPDALSGCQRVAATVGRDWAAPVPPADPMAIAPWLLAATEAGGKAALVFGREDRGLTDDELQYAQRWVRIPTAAAYPSMNLAQAVTVCTYALRHWTLHGPARPGNSPGETLRERADAPGNAPENAPGNAPENWAAAAAIAAGLTEFSELAGDRADPADLADFDAREAYYRDLETLLLAIGYLYPHTANSRMKKLRRLLDHAQPSAGEIALLRGMVRQVRWALDAASARSPGE